MTIKRDLTADLKICDAACIGPWIVDDNVASQVRQPSVSNRRRITLPPDANGLADATFIAAARTGWPDAIKRAMAAEAKLRTMSHVMYSEEARVDSIIGGLRAELAELKAEYGLDSL